MTNKVLLIHHKDEEALASTVAMPVKEAGYEVFYRGTVGVGDSEIYEVSKLINEGVPAVLCATERAMGTKLPKLFANAVRASSGKLFIVQMEEGADIEIFTFAQEIALYWQNKTKAMRDLIDALQKHYPLPIENTTSDEDRAIPISYPTETRVYLDYLLRNSEELEAKYVDLSAATQNTDTAQIFERIKSQSGLIPLSFSMLSKQNTEAEQKQIVVDSISEAMALHKHFVLLGDPGSGKSTTLQKILVTQAKKALHDAQEYIPVLINLAKWPAAIDDFSRLLAHEFTLQGIRSVHIDRTMLLLDGLNEIAAQYYSMRVKILEEWLMTFPRAAVIITSREKHYINNKRLSIPSVQILPFDNQRVRLFLCNWLGQEAAEKLFSEIGGVAASKNSERDLIHLANNPYLLLLICVVYKENNEQIPSSRGDLFRSFVKVLYAREQEHGLTYGLSYEQMLNAFSEVAFSMQHKRSATSVHTDWAAKHI